MRVLMLSQGRKIEDQPDFDCSFRRATSRGKPVELLNIPFVGYVEKHGADALYAEVVRANTEFKPDVVFFQFFHMYNHRSMRSPVDCIRALKESENRPLVFGSWGDPFNVGWQAPVGTPAPQHTYDLASVADAFFPTSMGPTARSLLRHGAKNIVFVPNAFCPCHFKMAEIDERPVKKYDAVMLGSCCPYFHPRIYWSFVRAYSRHKTVDVLMRQFGSRFAVYGKGWESCASARGSIPFKEQMSVFKEGRTVVDAPAQIDYDYYTSDRAFFIAASGSPLVMKYIPGLEKMLADSRHAYYAKSIAQIPETCCKILSLPEAVLQDRRVETLNLLKARHMIDNRVDTIVSVAEALQDCRLSHVPADHVLNGLRLWHFLPTVNFADIRRTAIVNWRG